jgi:pimeloyl-ACP methyl ester carboxylesterase
MPELTLTNGVRLAVSDTGSGAPLVLVHGSPAEGRAWSRVLRHLAPDFRVFVPDLPGYGGSTPLAARAGTAAMADAVAHVIDIARDAVAVAGHSYGANVALHAALARRDRVRSLVLFEPVFFRGLELAGERAALEGARAHFADYVRRVEGGDLGSVSRMIEFWFGPGAFEKLPPPVQTYLKNAAPKNAADVKASLSETVSAAELAAFDRPSLIAYGDNSPPVVATLARTLAKLLPRAEAVAIEGTTHGMLDTHPEAVAALINRRAAVAA